jgi:hypothetical protein
MKWLRSAGGPLLFLPETLLKKWNGILDESGTDAFEPAGGSSTDYDRACAATEYIELIPVGDGAGIILGDEPLPTTWRPPADRRWGCFVCWAWENAEESVAAAFARFAESDFQATGLIFNMACDRGVLFDSACPGNDVHKDDFLEIDLAHGSYEVQTGFTKHDGRNGLILHRLVALR